MIKIKEFKDYENGLEEAITEFILSLRNGATLKDIKYSTAIGNFDNNPYFTSSALIIYND